MAEHLAAWKSVEAALLARAEQRAAPRITLLIRPAKLVTRQGEFVCIIRDISATGASLRLFHRPPSDPKPVLKTESGLRIAMETVWRRDRDAGYQFAEPVDVGGVVSEPGRFPKRKLRLAIGIAVTLCAQGEQHPAEIRNISQQGARIACSARLALDQLVRIAASQLPEIRAKIRWRREEEYGLVFEDTFSIGDFARLAASSQAPELLEG